MRKKEESNKKPKRGRPKLNIDRAKVNELIDLGLSNREIAEIMKCDEKTIRNNFSAKRAKKREEEILKLNDNRKRLRKAQWKAAIKNKDTTMMIWLGKNVLGQSDKVENKEEANINYTRKVQK